MNRLTNAACVELSVKPLLLTSLLHAAAIVENRKFFNRSLIFCVRRFGVLRSFFERPAAIAAGR